MLTPKETVTILEVYSGALMIKTESELKRYVQAKDIPKCGSIHRNTISKPFGTHIDY